MPEFRCTRRRPYSNPYCLGHTDTRFRQGYYIEASSARAAEREMRRDFPDDLEGFDIEEIEEEVDEEALRAIKGSM